MTTKKTTGGSMMGLLTLLAIAGAQGCDGVEVDDGLSGAEGERLELDDELDLVLEEEDLDSEGEEEDDSEAPVDPEDDLDLVAEPGDDDGEAVLPDSTIYGVEYDSTLALSNLFRYTVSNSDFATIATLTRGGANVRVDGLSMASNGTLRGFVIEANGTDSTLVTIDTSTGAVTNVGSTLTNRKIVGGAFAYTNGTQQQWVLDTTSNQILRVSGVTGQEIAGSAVSLTLNGNPYSFADTADLTQHRDGSLWASFGASVFKVNTTTGALTNQANTNVSGTYLLPGVLFHPHIHGGEVIALDASSTDELLRVQVTTGTPGTVTSILGNGLTSANMGTGDLAAKPYYNGSGGSNYGQISYDAFLDYQSGASAVNGSNKWWYLYSDDVSIIHNPMGWGWNAYSFYSWVGLDSNSIIFAYPDSLGAHPALGGWTELAWEAPANGFVEVNASVWRTDVQNPDYGDGIGIQLTQENGSVLWDVQAPNNDGATKAYTNGFIPISAGQRLYLRVSSNWNNIANANAFHDSTAMNFTVTFTPG